MSLSVETVARFMTSSPVSVTSSCKLSEAHSLMKVMQFRHLPVVQNGQLVGVVSDRDVHLHNAFSGDHEEEMTVGEAMTPSPLSFLETSPLRDVAQRMAQLRCGSALIVNGAGQLTGIFTTVDACKALAVLCDEREAVAKAA